MKMDVNLEEVYPAWASASWADFAAVLQREGYSILADAIRAQLPPTYEELAEAVRKYGGHNPELYDLAKRLED